jgi:hypothetical protein
LLQRAAESGYAPAQARLSRQDTVEPQVAFEWAQKAAKQGNRIGLFLLGHRLCLGDGCLENEEKGLQLLRESAELECAAAQFCYSEFGIGDRDWERYHWWGRAVSRGYMAEGFRAAVFRLLRSFSKGENGRILQIVAPVMTVHLEAMRCTGSIPTIPAGFVKNYQRLIGLFDAMLGRARQAIACWSIVARRCGVVKDIRLVIAKMAWAEPWRWGEKETKKKKSKKKKAKRRR